MVWLHLVALIEEGIQGSLMDQTCMQEPGECLSSLSITRLDDNVLVDSNQGMRVVVPKVIDQVKL